MLCNFFAHTTPLSSEDDLDEEAETDDDDDDSLVSADELDDEEAEEDDLRGLHYGREQELQEIVSEFDLPSGQGLQLTEAVFQLSMMLN
jgi:hypothetical protein